MRAERRTAEPLETWLRRIAVLLAPLTGRTLYVDAGTEVLALGGYCLAGLSHGGAASREVKTARGEVGTCSHCDQGTADGTERHAA
jgi:hypothetical protein